MSAADSAALAAEGEQIDRDIQALVARSDALSPKELLREVIVLRRRKLDHIRRLVARLQKEERVAASELREDLQRMRQIERGGSR